MSIITLTGPTCSGKSTVEAELQRLGFGRAISHTTRWPRAGEVNGREYHFITDDTFRLLNDAGEFIETVEFGTAKYAMSAQSLRDAQQGSEHVAIVVEPHGAMQIHDFCEAHGMRSLAVWIDCDPKQQAQRWLNRLVTDLSAGKGMAPYVERLGMMLSGETGWRNNAWTYGRIGALDRAYDLLLDSTVATPAQIAAEVASLAAKKD